MKAPLSWLKEHVPVRAGAGEIARRLTFSGLEVEGIETVEGEPVLEVNVTPNRGDCLSIRGLAREVSALFGLPMKRPATGPAPKKPGGGPQKKSPVSVTVARPKECPRYALAVIENVRIGPSPEWLVRRLAQTGGRSVNNVVDVTNYVLMETGQPLHAFDRSKIRGAKIAVRRAKAGEILKTLDGVERKLIPDDLVIADGGGAVALAGVMGGADSEVDASTTSIALECAFFDPATVRRSARRLGIQSESSYRFERRVDPEGIPEALARAVSLIRDTAGGETVSVVDLYKVKQRPARIRFRPAEVAETLGGAWKDSEIRSDLQRLGFGIRPASKVLWTVTAPSHRGDIARPVDLVEEIARLSGLDRIEERFPPLAAPPRPGTDPSAERRIRALLSDLGLQETLHYSFVSPETVALLEERPAAALANPLGRDDSLMRTSLLAALLATAARHARHKMETFRAFELRKIFEPSPSGRPLERARLAGVLMGARLLSHWSDGIKGTDFYDIKGVVERILSALDLASRASLAGGGDPIAYLHPGQQARLALDGRPAGVLGELHPDVLARLGLKQPIYVFELDWDLLKGAGRPERRYREYSRVPIVERDLAVVVEETIPAGDLTDFIRRQDDVISDARVFDLYRGDQIAAGKKSLAFSIRMGRGDRTMTDEEVSDVFGKVVQGLKKEFQAEIR